MHAPSQGQSNVKGVVHTWYQFSTQSLSSWNSLRALWYAAAGLEGPTAHDLLRRPDL